jgi:hypothetical protein
MDEHSITKARNRFARDVHEAESGKDIALTRPRRFSEAWDAFTREFDLRELKFDPDEVFASVRDHAPGRHSGP